MINIVFVDPHMESIGHWIKWKQGFKLWFPHHDRNCCYTSHIVLQLFTTFLTTSRFMASSNPLFPKGNSIHRPPVFNGEVYHYWKTRMQIFIEAIDLNIWEAIEIGPYIPTVVDVSTSATTQKPRDKWTEEDRRRTQVTSEKKWYVSS